jgi:hypothetical protein
VRDKFGRSHYVLVEPDAEEAQFASGSPVLLLRREGDAVACDGGPWM